MTAIRQSFGALVVASALVVGTSLTLIDAAVAKPGKSPTSNQELAERKGDRLPANLANAVRLDLARRQRIPPGQIRVQEAKRVIWRNSCLELPQPDEVCAQATVAGWRIVLVSGNQRWVYHTDLNGRNIRLNSGSTGNSQTNLPDSVRQAVLQAAARRLNVSTSSLQIVRSQRREWPNSCLGLGGEGISCAAVITPGWEVTVRVDQQLLVYRTNESGSVVALDAQASRLNSGLTPRPIPTSELPPALERGVVFRAIASGGIAGRTSEIRLMSDGRVIHLLDTFNGGAANRRETKISQAQVQQFGRLLQQRNFSQFNRLSYAAPSGAADYFTVDFTAQSGTTRYADIVQDQLPQDLQAIINAWNQITRGV